MTPRPSPGAGSRRGALLRWLTIGLICSALFGCAVGALPHVERVPALKLIAPADAPLVTIARDIALLIRTAIGGGAGDAVVVSSGGRGEAP